MFFFQVLAGANNEHLKTLKLSRRSSDYFYINQGNVDRVDGINDATDYRTVVSSLNALQFSNADQDTLWRVVAAILHLGNIKFEKIDDDKLTLQKSKDVEYVADLLRVPKNDLIKSLFERVIAARGDIMRKEHTG